MNEELDSQLSAMFDDELAPEQCELLARRLSRDEQLKARWGRYAVISAAIRAERGVRLNAPLAGRVSAVIMSEPALGAAVVPVAGRRAGLRWWQPLAGSAVAAGVAAASILWLRAHDPGAPVLSAQVLAPAMSVRPAAALPDCPSGAASADPALCRYVTPRTPAVRSVVVPSTELAKYVVGHSLDASPLAGRHLMSAFMSESGSVEVPLEGAATDVR
jgi:anti sigma-E protein RseA